MVVRVFDNLREEDCFLGTEFRKRRSLPSIN